MPLSTSEVMSASLVIISTRFRRHTGQVLMTSFQGCKPYIFSPPALTIPPLPSASASGLMEALYHPNPSKTAPNDPHEKCTRIRHAGDQSNMSVSQSQHDRSSKATAKCHQFLCVVGFNRPVHSQHTQKNFLLLAGWHPNPSAYWCRDIKHVHWVVLFLGSVTQ
jgi:hypothetical protein